MRAGGSEYEVWELGMGWMDKAGMEGRGGEGRGGAIGGGRGITIVRLVVIVGI